MKFHNLRARLIRATMCAIRLVRPYPTNPHAPWSPVDAFANGLVKIEGKWYDLAFEVPFRSYAEWEAMWIDYARAAARDPS